MRVHHHGIVNPHTVGFGYFTDVLDDIDLGVFALKPEGRGHGDVRTLDTGFVVTTTTARCCGRDTGGRYGFGLHLGCPRTQGGQKAQIAVPHRHIRYGMRTVAPGPEGMFGCPFGLIEGIPIKFI